MMKFRNPETGQVFEDIDTMIWKECGQRDHCDTNCPLFKLRKHTACRDYVISHPVEAARLMGYEVVEEQVGDINKMMEDSMEKKEKVNCPDGAREDGLGHKPRICEVLGVEVGERFSIDGYPADYGLVQVCEDGKIRRVISTKEFPFADDGEVGNKIGSNALYYLLNHPESIIRKTRFTEEELALANILKSVGVELVERVAITGALRASSPASCAETHTAKRLWWLPDGLFPSLRPGQSVKLEDIPL